MHCKENPVEPTAEQPLQRSGRRAAFPLHLWGRSSSDRLPALGTNARAELSGWGWSVKDTLGLGANLNISYNCCWGWRGQNEVWAGRGSQLGAGQSLRGSVRG